jgi:PPOX class probable F420-dependent enzyme
MPTDKPDSLPSTATAQNALSQAELEALLAEPLVARLATHRADGFAHLTPVWFLYEAETFYFTLGTRRRHLRNLRRDPRATLLVDIDERPRTGPDGRVQAVMVAGKTELEDDAAVVSAYAARIDERYLGSQTEAMVGFSETYTLVVLAPVVVMSWDFAKG